LVLLLPPSSISKSAIPKRFSSRTSPPPRRVPPNSKAVSPSPPPKAKLSRNASPSSTATAAEGRAAQLTRDVAQVKNQLTAKTDSEQALNREIADLKREVAQAKLASAAASPEEIEAYKSSIATLQAKVTELEAGRGTVAGSTSSSTSAAAPSISVGATANVVSIGEKNAFVVLDIGTAQGVQVGQKLNVTRAANTVATAVVSSVQDAYSIAQINVGSIKGGLLKGDTATITN
jgi:hypothetical protein